MRQTIRADVGSVEFVCLDRDAPAPGQVAIAVLDAATGKAVGGAGITTFLDGTQHMTIAADADGQASLGRYLAGQPLQVLVRSAGHAPAWITVTPASDAAAAATTVRLHPGWGTMLVVRQPDPDSFRGLPLAGVRVSIDGLPAGTTDRHGMLLLTHTGKPHRIDLQHAEFVVHYGSIDAATGALDGDEALPFFVVMRRR